MRAGESVPKQGAFLRGKTRKHRSNVSGAIRKLAAGEAKAADLHSAYQPCAVIEGHEELSSKALGSRLAELGFERSKRGAVVRWGGLAHSQGKDDSLPWLDGAQSAERRRNDRHGWRAKHGQGRRR